MFTRNLPFVTCFFFHHMHNFYYHQQTEALNTITSTSSKISNGFNAPGIYQSRKSSVVTNLTQSRANTYSMAVAAAATIAELQMLARSRVPRMFYDYCDAGSWTESTYHLNETDFSRIKFRQRVARDISERTTHTTMIGQAVSMPCALAPIGMCGMHYANGEIAAAKAASKHQVPFTLSTMSISSIEEVAEACPTPFWFQLYVMKDKGTILALVS